MRKYTGVQSLIATIIAVALFSVTPLSAIADDLNPNGNQVLVVDGDMQVYDPNNPQASIFGWIDNGEQTEQEGSIDASVSTNGEPAIALDVYAGQEDTEFTVNDSVSMSIVRNESIDDNAMAISAQAVDSCSTTVNVYGDACSTMQLSNNETEATSSAVYAATWDETESNVSINLYGTANSTAIATGENSRARADAIDMYVNSKQNNVNITVTGDAISKAVADGDADAFAVYISDPGKSNITIDGSASASAISAHGQASAGVVSANKDDGNTVVHVKGDAIARTESNGSDDGIRSTNAILADAKKGASLSVIIDGKAVAEAQDPNIIPCAGWIVASGQGSSTNVSIGNGAEGVIDIHASEMAKANAMVKGGIKVEKSDFAVAVSSENGNAGINLEGGLDAKNSYCGINAVATGENAVTSVISNGDISLQKRENCDGAAVLLEANEQGTVKAIITVDIIDATAVDGEVSGLLVQNCGGSIEANIMSDITATGSLNSTGMTVAATWSSSDYYIVEDAQPLVFDTDDVIPVPDVLVNGVETTIYEKDDELYFRTEEGKYLLLAQDFYVKEGNSRVFVIGDIFGGDAGMWVQASKEQKTEILVDGTVKGGKEGIVLNMDDSIADANLTLTVWEVKPDTNGAVLVRRSIDENHNIIYEEDKEDEKAIQYIIRIADSSKEYIKTNGTTEYEGYNVAREGDTVTLKLTIPEGYEITGAFSDVAQEAKLVKDENGNYYLIVPRGGAVELSVTMAKIEKPVTVNNSVAEETNQTAVQAPVYQVVQNLGSNKEDRDHVLQQRNIPYKV